MRRIHQFIEELADKLTPRRIQDQRKAEQELAEAFYLSLSGSPRGVREMAAELIIIQERLERMWQIKYRLLVALGAIVLTVSGAMVDGTDRMILQCTALGMMILMALTDWLEDKRGEIRKRKSREPRQTLETHDFFPN